MKKSLFICITLLAFTFLSKKSYSQSVYLFQYNFHSNEDSTDYTCLFFRNENGSGKLRLNYKSSQGDTVKKELQIEESFFTDADNNNSPKILAIKTIIDSEDLSDRQTNPIAPVFLFTYHDATGYFEPSGIAAHINKPMMDSATVFSYKAFSKNELTKETAASFFDKADPFFVSYFSGNTRGGAILNMLEQKNLNLHLFIVADTLDKTIGKSAAADMKNMIRTFTQFSQMLGIKKENFKEQIFAGKNCESKLILNAINRLTPTKNDIVIFYYTGHGFRTNQQDSFPFIKSTRINTDSATIVKNSLRIKEDIFNRIISKKTKARLNIIISDCCNIDIEKPKTIGNPVGKTRGEWELNEKNTRDLFLGFKPLSILITAAKNGEKAICDPEYNSYMSFAFLAALKQYTGRGEYKVSWNKLLDATGKKTLQISNQVCCSKPCCGPSCTTGKPERCVQNIVYSIRN